MRPKAGGVAVTLTLVALWGSGAAAESPDPVSPGKLERSSVIEGLCPTFTWTAVGDAESYHLAAYELADDASLGERALHVELPGGAVAWTPGEADCLESGERYAWTIRSSRSGWSSPRFFETRAVPAAADAAAALAVLGRYLEAGGELEELIGASPRREAGTGRPGLVQAVPGWPSATSVDQLGESTLPAAAEERRQRPDRAADTAGPQAVEAVQNLGFSAVVEHRGSSNSVGVQGVFDSTNSGDYVAGLLGVSVPNTDGGIFISPYLKSLDDDEIGVLGFSANDSSDNWGVVGVGGESAWGGRFLHSDSLGAVDAQVMLGGVDPSGRPWAADNRGDIRVRDGALVCPADTHAVGSWCIGAEETARSWQNALKNCWGRGMRLCPLDAIMACDHLEPAGAICTIATDRVDTNYKIWLGDRPTVYMAVELSGPNHVDVRRANAWYAEKGWAYAPTYNYYEDLTTPNELIALGKGNEFFSFCCTTPR